MYSPAAFYCRTNLTSVRTVITDDVVHGLRLRGPILGDKFRYERMFPHEVIVLVADGYDRLPVVPGPAKFRNGAVWRTWRSKLLQVRQDDIAFTNIPIVSQDNGPIAGNSSSQTTVFGDALEITFSSQWSPDFKASAFQLRSDTIAPFKRFGVIGRDVTGKVNDSLSHK